MPFLAVIVLIVVGSGMQPREQQLQDGGGNGGGGGGRIIVKLGALVVVHLFVIIVVPPVKMVDVGKPGHVVFGCRRALVQDPDTLLPPSQQRCHHQSGVVVLVLVFVIRA